MRYLTQEGKARRGSVEEVKARQQAGKAFRVGPAKPVVSHEHDTQERKADPYGPAPPG